MAQAVHEAHAMAAGFGKKVGAVAGISSGELKNLTRAAGPAPADRFYDRGRGKRAAQAELLMVSALKMAQTVDLIFRIK